MARYFLAIVGMLYLALAIWCTTSPLETSTTVGLTRQAGQGESEFLTIYGGLEMGLAILFLIPMLQPEQTRFALLACLIIHACLVMFRSLAFFLYQGFPPITYKLACGEWILFVGALLFCLLERRRKQQA